MRRILPDREIPRLIEKLETLNGERPRALHLAAVRRGQVAGLAGLTPKSREVAAAPTQAEHNALVEDVAAIMAALRRLGEGR